MSPDGNVLRLPKTVTANDADCVAAVGNTSGLPVEVNLKFTVDIV